jgi:hypothetical protein
VKMNSALDAKQLAFLGRCRDWRSGDLRMRSGPSSMGFGYWGLIAVWALCGLMDFWVRVSALRNEFELPRGLVSKNKFSSALTSQIHGNTFPVRFEEAANFGSGSAKIEPTGCWR